MLMSIPQRKTAGPLSNLSDDIGVDLLDKAELIVSSPSGGAHLYFSKPEELKLPKQHSNYPGLDFLTKGCQVLGAGSQHVTGKKYVVNTEVSAIRNFRRPVRDPRHSVR